jgi:hypothetical protein
MDADGHGSGRFNPDSESGPRRSAADAATKGFEQEHAEETEKKQREAKILSKMRNSWG